MNLLPLRKYNVLLNKSPEDFKRLVSNEISRNKSIKGSLFNSTGPIFNGYLVENRIKLKRKGYGNTTLIPSIECHLSETKNGLELKIRISYNIIVNIFLTIWFGLLFTFLLVSIINAFITMTLNIGLLVTPVLFLLGYGIIMISFSIELETIRKYLREKIFIYLE